LRTKPGDERDWLRLEVDCLMKLGVCMALPARRDEAVAIYKQVIPLAERLARDQNDSPDSADLRAACHNSYASILGKDRFELAKAEYKKAIELRERPDVLAIPHMSNRLAQSVVNLGVIHWKEHDYPQAEARFRQAEDVLLSSKNSIHERDREAAISLGQVAVNWVGLLWELKRSDQAVARADIALERLESYVRNEPNDQVARDLCLKLHGNRGQALNALGRYREAADDWAKVVALASEPVPAFYRITFAMQLLKNGELDRAVAQARLAEQAVAISGEDLYNVSCFFCRVAALVHSDESTKPDDRARRRESFLADSIAALRKAAQAGFFRDPAVRELALKDPDLDALRTRQDFQRLIDVASAGETSVQRRRPKTAGARSCPRRAVTGRRSYCFAPVVRSN
jgi:tetratricopeptide (TPR) repeat protein